MLVTIDYDGTLTRSDVQDYLKRLRSGGFRPMVLTSRYGYIYKDRDGFGYEQNRDLFDKVEGMGFKKEDVCFTNGGDKCGFIRSLRPLIHLDNDSSQVRRVMEETGIVGVNVAREGWQSEADYILGI